MGENKGLGTFLKFVKLNDKHSKNNQKMNFRNMKYSRSNSLVGGVIGKILNFVSWSYLIFFSLFILGSLIYLISNWSTSFLFFAVVVFGFMFIPSLLALFFIKMQKDGKKMMNDIDWALTAKGKSARSESLKLMKYMQTYPHVEDRLANELVGHSVAFGIGKEWMKKLGGMKALSDLVFEKYGSKDVHMYFMDGNDYVEQFFE
jgi:hypothetical protein